MWATIQFHFNCLHPFSFVKQFDNKSLCWNKTDGQRRSKYLSIVCWFKKQYQQCPCRSWLRENSGSLYLLSYFDFCGAIFVVSGRAQRAILKLVVAGRAGTSEQPVFLAPAFKMSDICLFGVKLLSKITLLFTELPRCILKDLGCLRVLHNYCTDLYLLLWVRERRDQN